MVPMEALAIHRLHWCQWSLWCYWKYYHWWSIGANVVIDAIGVNDTCEKWKTHRHSMVPLVPILSLVQMCTIFHQCIIHVSYGSPLSPLELFSPLTPLPPLVLLYDQCIMIVSMYHRWCQCCYCSHWSPLVPLTFVGYFNLHITTQWCQWSYLISTIDYRWSNGDRHRRQWWSSLVPMTMPMTTPMAMGCTIGPIRSITIGTNGSPLSTFFVAILVQIAPMAKIINRYGTFTEKNIRTKNYWSMSHLWSYGSVNPALKVHFYTFRKLSLLWISSLTTNFKYKIFCAHQCTLTSIIKIFGASQE